MLYGREFDLVAHALLKHLSNLTVLSSPKLEKNLIDMLVDDLHGNMFERKLSIQLANSSHLPKFELTTKTWQTWQHFCTSITPFAQKLSCSNSNLINTFPLLTQHLLDKVHVPCKQTNSGKTGSRLPNNRILFSLACAALICISVRSCWPAGDLRRLLLSN